MRPPKNTGPHSLLRSLLDAAVAPAQPAAVVPAHLPVPPRGRLIVIGAGKGSGAMARGASTHAPHGDTLGAVTA